MHIQEKKVLKAGWSDKLHCQLNTAMMPRKLSCIPDKVGVAYIFSRSESSGVLLVSHFENELLLDSLPQNLVLKGEIETGMEQYSDRNYACRCSGVSEETTKCSEGKTKPY